MTTWVAALVTPVALGVRIRTIRVPRRRVRAWLTGGSVPAGPR